MFRPAPASVTDGERLATTTTSDGPEASTTTNSKSFVDVAVECARSVLRSRIVSTPNDKQGVAFFATANARGLDDAEGGNNNNGGGGGAREGVWVEQRMNVPSARRIQDLADLAGARGNERLRDKIGATADADADAAADERSYYDALLRAHHVAREMLNDHAPGAKVRKRVLLFTNRDDPLARRAGEDGRELVSAWREFRDVHRIDVTLYSLPRESPSDDGVSRYRDFDPAIFYENLTTRDDEDDGDTAVHADNTGQELALYAGHGHELVACSADRIDGLSLAFRKKSRKRRRVRGTTFRFGSGDGSPSPSRSSRPRRRPRSPRR